MVCGLNGRARGYTYIELVVVILLVALMLSLAMPRIRDSLLSDELKGTTRRLVGLIRNLRTEAVARAVDFALHLDLDQNLYWVESSSMSPEERAREQKEARPFPKGVTVLDVWLRGSGKIMSGEVWITISRKGYIQPSVIHLAAEDGRIFTLELSPFLGKVGIYERYVEYEEV
ncbi:MAG: hypothetical protein JRJ03_10685 [Deltaproteobacteria bacterium]|nr:hypothetical protein [Deltaproteobacteria bacterium]MBW2065384.1 hypothetical protein [Deltaproteobacteria bacterium]